MAKSKNKRVREASPYIRRALTDEYAQDQLRNALNKLRDVYGRVSRKQAAAAEDRRLYRSLKEAAVSIRRAAGRIEEPPPPKHTLRKVLIVPVAVGAALLMVKRRRNREDELPVTPSTDYAGLGEDLSSQPMPAHTSA